MQDFREMLREKGFRITPQRLAVLELLANHQIHPTAEQLIGLLKEKHPDIATGTVYKILDAFTAKGLIRKVKTDRDVMRYDAIMGNHHHLYCAQSDRIEDYWDDELNEILAEYFAKKGIPDFEIKDVRLQIIGRFSDKNNLSREANP